MLEADFTTGAILISFGAVLGVASPVQLLLMILFEVIFYNVSIHHQIKNRTVIVVIKIELIQDESSQMIHTVWTMRYKSLVLNVGENRRLNGLTYFQLYNT